MEFFLVATFSLFTETNQKIKELNTASQQQKCKHHQWQQF